MRKYHAFVRCYSVLAIALMLGATVMVRAAEFPKPESYLPSAVKAEQQKRLYDDPRPYLKSFGPKQVLPKELYEKFAFNIDDMKVLWADVVGFKAPDIVGKIHPEIKPGKYTYKDLQKYPGLKELMPPQLYERIKPGAPPFAGNMPEFEIVPTRQYYYATPIAKAVKENAGKAQLDSKGYMLQETFKTGIPFPRPSGQFKAQQAVYNWQRSYTCFGLNMAAITRVQGYDKNLNSDFGGVNILKYMPLGGRVYFPPFGYFDERAKKLTEYQASLLHTIAPRDSAGFVLAGIYHLDPEVFDSPLIYVPAIRRIKKMSATDTQDPIQGQDIIYDDQSGFMQKISPNRYPNKFEIVAEREYLIPVLSDDGAEYITSKGLEIRNARFERRPMYVIKLTQQDPNYVYSKRILYIDKETFILIHAEYYDQKGRLYRTYWGGYGFHPDMGAVTIDGGIQVTIDHIDKHSGLGGPNFVYPAVLERGDINMESVFKKSK